VQVRLLGVRDDHDAYAFRVADRLRGEGFRADVIEASEKLGARIRKAKLEKIPYVLVVGDDDVEHGTVGVNRRGSDEPERGVSVDDFVDRVRAEVVGRVNS
jgi:threonyl-tRNA synthetase